MLVTALTFLLGALAVLQATINRHIALQWGIAPTVALNAAVIGVVAALFYAAVRVGSVGNEFVLHPGASLAQMKWWWVVPGLIGFALVAGLPYAVDKIGALRVFVGVVAAQMITSLVWDAAFEKTPATLVRVLGAGLAVVSVLLVSWK